jgi:hypothetical protein
MLVHVYYISVGTSISVGVSTSVVSTLIVITLVNYFFSSTLCVLSGYWSWIVFHSSLECTISNVSP